MILQNLIVVSKFSFEIHKNINSNQRIENYSSFYRGFYD